MAGVDIKTIHNTTIKNVVLILDQEWGVINQWIKTPQDIGHAMICGK